MKTLSRMIAVVMLVAGFGLTAAPVLQGAGCCSSNGGCCVTSPGDCCKATSAGCETFSCKPPI